MKYNYVVTAAVALLAGDVIGTARTNKKMKTLDKHIEVLRIQNQSLTWYLKNHGRIPRDEFEQGCNDFRTFINIVKNTK